MELRTKKEIVGMIANEHFLRSQVGIGLGTDCFLGPDS